MSALSYIANLFKKGIFFFLILSKSPFLLKKHLLHRHDQAKHGTHQFPYGQIPSSPQIPQNFTFF